MSATATEKALESFDIRNFRDSLEPSPKAKDKYICPVCKGNNLSIHEATGKYKCFNGCEKEHVREAIKPWSEVQAERKGTNTTPKRVILPKKSNTPKPKPVPFPEGELSLVRLVEPATDIPQPQKLLAKPPKGVPGNSTEITYIYSPTQWIVRYQWADEANPKGYDKTFRQWNRLPDGTRRCGRGINLGGHTNLMKGLQLQKPQLGTR